MMQLQNQLVALIRDVVPDGLTIYRFGTWGTPDFRDDSDGSLIEGV